ncbi:T9SS type A sorting domain-containing protein [Dyadobacter flavalbus]|uniref:T9SS type A sorting domain-containing protein n=1 Tax=Dyadobacter flavalbus TaxID=2579942 RepID=UPI0013759C60|nr:T9SS type A sorting domain-containing protein [Dyadobacter flavalbus]
MSNQDGICQDSIFRFVHEETDTSDESQVNLDTVINAGKASVTQSCQKHFTPLSKDVFDNMLNTVRNRVSASLTISLFPNPVSDKLIIVEQDWRNMKSIQLFTIYGKSVYKSELPQSEIDVGSFANGMYVLIITDNDGSQYSQKVMINTE